MRQTQNLYEYLYRSILTQIECGAFLGRQELPSQQELCRKYHVGITTVRRVMKLLEENGYILTSPGKPAVIRCQGSAQAAASALLGRRQEVADAFKGLGMMLPALYCEGARRCGPMQLEQLRQAADEITPQMNPASLRRCANLFFTILAGALRNQLVLELQLDAENFLNVPYLSLPGVEDPSCLPPQRVKAGLLRALEMIESGRFSDLYQWIVEFYKEAAQRTDTYFTTLVPYAGQISQGEPVVHWFQGKVNSELYVRLGMVLMRRIAAGEFDNQRYLPSIPQLMEEYGVTKETASRTIALLNQIGVAQTLDKRGTILAPPNSQPKKQFIPYGDEPVRQRLVTCLETLQIMALTARSCVSRFPGVPQELIHTISARLDAVGTGWLSPLSVQLLMSCFHQWAPCQSLKNIYYQLSELMLWGYYLKPLDSFYHQDLTGTQQAMRMVVSALLHPGQEGLPQAMQEAFLQIYRDVSAILSRLYGESLTLPAAL